MKVTDKITITNEDNMELMARYPDKYFDLAIVDPPYGILNKTKRGKSNYVDGKKYENWDIKPNEHYFKELRRVSKNQIIWGGNYFGYLWNILKYNQGFIIWDKTPTMPTYSDCELAWCSFEIPNKIFKMHINSDNDRRINKIHPTQKPIELYKWLLDKYAKQGDKILDTHLGSGSIAIACHDYDFELMACELDAEYYEKAVQRIKNHTSQQRLF